MPIGAGTRIGPYEVTALIGEGGMGKVWRAHHTALKRDDALKVLPDAFASDPERLARFRREAQFLASLNHPNIAHVHGLEQSDGVQALVMELVEGPTLADRIAQGPIPVEEALPIAKQIAEALEAAHEQGIIHRDLKPANIKVRPDGTVKVLDFGLAKALDPVVADVNATASPTITSPAMMTGVGVLLGTAAYMSPEQARGRAADKRSDIWAFGCVLFEMLTAKRAFDGEDIAVVLASVIKAEPDWTALPADLPVNVRALLAGCLEKDRKRRLTDIAVVTFLLNGGASQGVAGGTSEPARSPLRRLGIFTAGAIGVALIGAGIFWLAAGPQASPLQIMRLQIAVPGALEIANSGVTNDLAIAPDGSFLVYPSGGTFQAVIRRIDQVDAVPLQGITGIRAPFISPDSRWIGYFGPMGLTKVSVGGGSPISITGSLAGGARGASWGPDDLIVFATNDPSTGLLAVSASGGEQRVLTKPENVKDRTDHVFPSMLPDGLGVLFTIIRLSSGSFTANSDVAVLDLRTGEQKTLIPGGSNAQYVESGHLVYSAGGTLRAVPFDPRRLELRGDPLPVLQEVLTSGIGMASFSVARTGTLVYIPGGVLSAQFGTPRTLLWVDRQGREVPIPLPPRTYTYPRISPDGTRMALDIRDQNNDIWIADLGRLTLTPLTADPGNDYYPVWTPDSRRIIFQSSRLGGSVLSQAADGTGTTQQLFASANGPHWTYSVSPGGNSVVLQQMMPKSGIDLMLLRLDGTPRTEPLIQTSFVETNGEISPDGRWLAYQSNESGQEEIYVRPFPDVDAGRWPISVGGGTRPAWAPNGRELFYLDGEGLLTAVAVQPGSAFNVGTPKRVLKTRYFGGFGGGGQAVAGRTYDVAPDGRRFLMIKDVATDNQSAATPSIVVVINWFEELKRLLPIN